MPKKLTKLRIDEISSVDRGANEGAQIILMKRDNGDVILQRENGDYSYLPSWTQQNGALLFSDVMLRKQPEPPDDEHIREDKKLSERLDEVVAEMIARARGREAK